MSEPAPSSGSSSFAAFKKDGCIVRITDPDNPRHHNKFGLISHSYQGKHVVKVQLDGLPFQQDHFNELNELIDFHKKNTERELFAPESIQLVCSHCMDDNGGNLKKCSVCRVALYCGRPCQKEQWKEHKEFCERLKINELKASDSSVDHPSWRNRDKLTKRKLRTSHALLGCKTQWPLSLETNAMLSLYFPSFLTAHPNMQFDFDGSYLTEILTEDLRQVPSHLPRRMCYAVVGEVIWTEICEEYFSETLRSSSGFQLPPGATALCPGTGTKITPSATEVHLFVLCVQMATSEGGSIMRAVFPRILTFEGFDRMRGSAEATREKKEEATPEKASKFWIIYRDTLDFKTRNDFLYNMDSNIVDRIDGPNRRADRPQ